MRPSALRRAAGLAGLLLLGGCFALRERTAFDDPLSPGRVAAIRPGVTTRLEILEAFGRRAP